MINSKTPKATHAGKLLGTLPCYVLDDGRRIISQRGLFHSLGLSDGNTRSSSLQKLLIARSSDSKNADVFDAASDNSSEAKASSVRSFVPVEFRPLTGGKAAFGYEAKALIELCEAILGLRSSGGLTGHNEHIADRAEALLIAFARVGVTALVDEACGYIRPANELQRLLALYVTEELRPWLKTFPDEFFRQLFRLRGWIYPPRGNRTPRYVGKLINFIVYSRLPPGLLDELRAKNPIEGARRKHKHHQFLTVDVGNRHLEGHLQAVTAMMRGCRTWDGFVQLLNHSYPIANTQFALFDEVVR